MQAERQLVNVDTSPVFYDIIVVGTGPVGIRLVQELVKNNSPASIALFGDEPWKPYNRIHLSALVSGEQKEESIYTQVDFTSNDNITPYYNHRIIDINRYSKVIIDELGNKFTYGKLILATGSTPRIPAIDGIKLKNIFTFRDMNDAQFLMGRSVRTRKTVIIGGGLLGLEAAHAMQRFNTEVTVIEHNMWLMYSQLDQRAGSYLKQHVETLGINVRLNKRVVEIAGDDKVNGVLLNDNEFIECDTLIIAAGILPNIEIARNSGLKIGKGIKVNDHLQTNDEHIYAIGECAEHREKTYGMVAPGYEQAAVLSHVLLNKKAQYKGSTTATQLKVIDYPVFSIGNTGHSVRERETIVYQDHQKEIYRKIVVINGRLRGMVAIGELQGASRLQQAVSQQRRIWPWHIKRFQEKGSLWLEDDLENVMEWPASAIVCNCTGVTRGQLEQAQIEGAKTIAQISSATGASSVCGSCRHLVSNFIGSHAPPVPVKAFKPLLITSVLGLMISLLLLLLPGMYYNNSVESFNWDIVWRDSLFKQVSGYSLLAISLAISVITLRKRWKRALNKWDFSYWRIAHVAIGILLFATLFLHTGYRFGDNLNLLLMLTFSGLLFSGAVAGTAIAIDHLLSRKLARRLRNFSVWGHILLLWPLPALLGFHIIKTYYF